MPYWQKPSPRTAPIRVVENDPVTQQESLGASLGTTHQTPEAASGEPGRRLRADMRVLGPETEAVVFGETAQEGLP